MLLAMNETDPSLPWRIVVEFAGLDLDDDDLVDALVSDPAIHFGLSSSEFVTTVEAVVPAENPPAAVADLCDAVHAVAPQAVVLRVVDPLVTIADIAEDAGVSRQAVRNWALGLRQSGFPRPLAIVGDGVRVWRQADVDAWLASVMNLGSGHQFAPATFVAGFNETAASGVPDAAETFALSVGCL